VTALHDITLRPNHVELVIGGISANEMRTLTCGETDFGGIVPIKGMGDRGIEVKHTLQSIDKSQKVKGRTIGRINVLLQNSNDTAVTIKKGEEIGGYRPQCEHAEDRYELASVTGTMLASALGYEGAGLINENAELTRYAIEAKTDREHKKTDARSKRQGTGDPQINPGQGRVQ
jgi:hypothetical protein